MRSMALRPRYRTGEKQAFQRRVTLDGMLGAAPLASRRLRRPLSSSTTNWIHDGSSAP